MKFLFWSIALLISSLAHAEEPQVYTGVLEYTNSSRVMLSRIFVIPKGDSEVPDIHLNHYLGGFNSNEVIPTHFDFVSRQSDGTLVLTDKRSKMDNSPYRVPTLFLKETAEGGYEGDYVSTEDGIAGKLYFVKGWSIQESMTKNKVITPSFEGEYVASCHGFGSRTIVQLMELVATRFESKDMSMIPGSDTTLKAVNYLGALSCAPSNYPDSVETSCGAFDRGNYDHYKNRFNLHVSFDWQYSCEVLSGGDLDCEGPRRQSCEFTRFKSDRDIKFDVVGTAPPYKLPDSIAKPANDTLSPVTPTITDCNELSGITDGILRHGATGLYQRIRLEARATEGQANGELNCQLVGSLRQYFNETDDHNIFPLTHVLSNSFYFPNSGRGRIGASRVGGDAQLIIWKASGLWHGNWYSTLFGYVGEIVLSKNFTGISRDEGAQYVPSISGVFTQEPQHEIDIKRKISILGYPDTSDTASFDPLRQVKMTGNIESTAFDHNGDPGFSTISALDTITYNYFSGIATFIGPSSYFYCKVTPSGLDVKIITKRWGGSAMKPWWTWDYIRQ